MAITNIIIDMNGNLNILIIIVLNFKSCCLQFT